MKLIPIRIQRYDEGENPNYISLVTKDEQFLQLNELIEAKRRMLLEKQKKIKIVSKQNKFLEEIKEDYSNYYNYIIQQKKDQMKALELLHNYINDLSVSGNLSKQNLVDSKHEQKKIMNELNSIKTNLDVIINDTDIISNNIIKK